MTERVYREGQGSGQEGLIQQTIEGWETERVRGGTRKWTEVDRRAISGSPWKGGLGGGDG